MRLLTCGTKSHQTSISDLKCSALSSEQKRPSSICSTPRMIESFILYELEKASSFACETKQTRANEQPIARG